MMSPTSTRHRQHSCYAFLSSLPILATQLFSASALDNVDDATSIPSTSKVAAYYGPRSYHERNGLSRPDNIDYSKLSRIMYGPFAMNEHGNIWGKDVNADPQILFGPPDWNPEPNAQKHCYQSSPDNQPLCAHYHYDEGLISRAHSHGVDVFPNIGGPEYSDQFAKMAADPGARSRFAQNAVFLMTSNNFDGLDLAWQYPNSGEEMFNYMLLIGDLLLAMKGYDNDRTSFNITATLPCDDNIEHIDIRGLGSVLSGFNLLSYDFQGPWGGTVGANSPLYDPPDRAGQSVSSCVNAYIEGGATRDQIKIGLPFFGHSYLGAKKIGDQCKASWDGVCTDTNTWHEDGGSPQYYNIYKHLPKMALTWDSQTATPLGQNDQGVVSYDDPRSICLKTEYALSNAGGIVIFDLTSDMLDDRSTPLLDAANMKMSQPDIDCDGDEFKKLFSWRKVDQYTSSEQTHSKKKPEIAGPTSNEIRDPVEVVSYMCGVGEGNAKDNCANGDSAYGCEYGTCPPGMLCFVVLCAKPFEPSEADLLELHALDSKGDDTSSTKPEPKKKPIRKPEKEPLISRNEEKQLPISTEVSQLPDTVDLRDEIATTIESTEPFMLFSCGFDSTHAASCGQACPNGVMDCPRNQFCFWLECDSPVSIESSSNPLAESWACGDDSRHASSCENLCPNGVTDCPIGQFCFQVECDALGDPLISTDYPTESPTDSTNSNPYQCGVTRDEALECSEACDAAWKCSDGKDCYNVPC